ncbi:MAG: hypothetical protein Ct9H300mP8_11830 [Gammaproteobacteria bacterium]|nr:MAG: hypothetical protein Ct9H300mP8_11830 [Gammaproteobacteria bacterium]
MLSTVSTPKRLRKWPTRKVGLGKRDSGLIRHRGKFNGRVANARIFDEMTEPGRFLWSFVNDTPLKNSWRQGAEVPSKTGSSKKCHEP